MTAIDKTTSETPTDSLRIVELRASNFKRLKAVCVRPDEHGNMVVISGRNGQGKTSLLDVIEVALGGKDRAPREPVRRGEPMSELVVDMGDIVARRTITADGGSSLVVSNKDGARFNSPQAMLDKLVGRLSFDPLSFSRQKAKEQAETLRDLLGLDFTDALYQRDKAFLDRTAINRSVRQMEGALASMPAAHGGLPDRASVSDLAAKLRAAQEHNANEAEHGRVMERAERDVDAQREVIADIEDRLREAKLRLVSLQSKVEELAAMKRKPVIDLDPIQRQIDEAEGINQKHAENEQRAKAEAALEVERKASDELTERIKKLDKERIDAIAAAAMPVPGLGFSDSGDVTLNGLPLEQASAAEQLRVSVAIGLAMNPRLRVLLIRDASLLDGDSMRLVAEMARESNAQLWVERIETDEMTTVVIEDGSIVGGE